MKQTRFRRLLTAVCSIAVGPFVLVLVGVVFFACNEDAVRKDLVGPSAAAVAGVLQDTANASSICRASVRTRQAAQHQLTTAPGDSSALKKAKTFGALVTDACK